MGKSLLMLPGAVDPNHKDNENDFSRRYHLVEREAIKLGYEKIELLPWIGQKSGGVGFMNLKTATHLLNKKINELEKAEEYYDIIAFSWGANVYLNVMSLIEQPKYLKRTVLWGIDEFWRMANYFSNDDKLNAIIEFMNKNGTNIDPQFITYEIPNEAMLLDYQHSNSIRIGFGENDEQSPPAYADYLKSMKLRDTIEFRVVPEVGHVVTEYNEAYLRCLFE